MAGWECSIENTLIYLTGFPATGKLTISKTLAEKTGATLIDNHTINNPILQIVRKSGAESFPDEVWRETEKIRTIVFDAMVKLAPQEENFILTNVLVDYKGDRKLFELVENTARRRGAKFIPVCVTCNRNILMTRVKNSDRAAKQKLIDPDRLREILDRWRLLPIKHPNHLEIDNSRKSIKECAAAILAHIEAL